MKNLYVNQRKKLYGSIIAFIVLVATLIAGGLLKNQTLISIVPTGALFLFIFMYG